MGRDCIKHACTNVYFPEDYCSAVAMEKDPELNGFEDPQDDREYRMQYMKSGKISLRQTGVLEIKF